MAAPAQNHLRGIALSCAGFTAWTLCDALIKLASQTLTPAAVMLVCVLFGSLTNVILAHCNGGLRQIKTTRIRFHLLRGLLCVISFYACCVALKHLPLTSFYMIVFVSPLMIALVEKLILKEPAPWPVWFAIVFGFCGIIVAAQAMQAGQDGAAATTNLGLILAFVCATAYSAIAIMTRYARHENNFALSLWPDLLIAPCAALLMLWEGGWHFTAEGFGWAAVSGVLNGLGFLATNASLRLAPAAIVSPYHYSQIVTGAVLGYLIWGNVPVLGVLAGAIMIVASGLYILRHSHRTAPAAIPAATPLQGD